jgi:hypothetical protein
LTDAASGGVAMLQSANAVFSLGKSAAPRKSRPEGRLSMSAVSQFD